jgi:signal transduction histidine kinase
MGLTPLYMAVLTKPTKIFLWTGVSIIVLVGNGILIDQNIGSYAATVNPIIFIVGGCFFMLTTSTVAVFFNYTEKRMRAKLYKKNFQLEALSREVEDRNEQLKNYNEHLEERVHERTAELERQNYQLAEYAFINSHLVRGPLARILGITSLMARTTTTREQKDLIEHLNKASAELDEVISNINLVLDKEGKIDRRALEKLRDH